MGDQNGDIRHSRWCKRRGVQDMRIPGVMFGVVTSFWCSSIGVGATMEHFVLGLILFSVGALSLFGWNPQMRANHIINE